jgi:hypothetical protein
MNEQKSYQKQSHLSTLVDHPPTSKSQPQQGFFSNIRAFTRLMIGGLIIGTEKFTDGVSEWESRNTEKTGIIVEEIHELGKDEQSQSIKLTSKNESNFNTIHYLFVGLLFKSQEKLEERINKIDKTTRQVGKFSNRFLSPVAKNRLTKPFWNGFDNLVQRGEEQVNEWITLGKSEEIQSKQMIENAAYDQVDTAFNYLAENEDVQEIIQGQGVSLASEIIEEIRERAISADILLEGTIRTIFKMKSRSELPPPPTEVTSKVKHIRIKRRI